MDRAALAHLRHELRTPLNHIIGYGEMLLEDGAGPELAAGLRRILDEAGVLLGLVNDVLAPAAVEEGSVDLTRLPERLGPSLDRVLASCEELLGRTAGGGRDVGADLARIAQAARHLRELVHGGLAPRVAERTEALPLPDLPAVADDAAAPTPGTILVVDDNEEN